MAQVTHGHRNSGITSLQNKVSDSFTLSGGIISPALNSNAKPLRFRDFFIFVSCFVTVSGSPTATFSPCMSSHLISDRR